MQKLAWLDKVKKLEKVFVFPPPSRIRHPFIFFVISSHICCAVPGIFRDVHTLAVRFLRYKGPCSN